VAPDLCNRGGRGIPTRGLQWLRAARGAGHGLRGQRRPRSRGRLPACAAALRSLLVRGRPAWAGEPVWNAVGSETISHRHRWMILRSPAQASTLPCSGGGVGPAPRRAALPRRCLRAARPGWQQDRLASARPRPGLRAGEGSESSLPSGRDWTMKMLARGALALGRCQGRLEGPGGGLDLRAVQHSPPARDSGL
jgi:hypothetical protein